jgi:hypothetical protein
MLEEIKNKLKSIIGSKCWDASNLVTGTLKLYFGDAVFCRFTHKNGSDFSHYIGQYEILIWSEWRLDSEDEALCSSSSDEEIIENTVFQLIGDTVQDIIVFPPVWDIHIKFLSGKILKIFCLNTQDSDNLSNWNLGFMDNYYFIGKGSKLKKSINRDIVPSSLTSPHKLPPIDLSKRIETIRRCILAQESACLSIVHNTENDGCEVQNGEIEKTLNKATYC